MPAAIEFRVNHVLSHQPSEPLLSTLSVDIPLIQTSTTSTTTFLTLQSLSGYRLDIRKYDSKKASKVAENLKSDLGACVSSLVLPTRLLIP